MNTENLYGKLAHLKGLETRFSRTYNDDVLYIRIPEDSKGRIIESIKRGPFGHSIDGDFYVLGITEREAVRTLRQFLEVSLLSYEYHTNWLNPDLIIPYAMELYFMDDSSEKAQITALERAKKWRGLEGGEIVEPSQLYLDFDPALYGIKDPPKRLKTPTVEDLASWGPGFKKAWDGSLFLYHLFFRFPELMGSGSEDSVPAQHRAIAYAQNWGKQVPQIHSADGLKSTFRDSSDHNYIWEITRKEDSLVLSAGVYNSTTKEIEKLPGGLVYPIERPELTLMVPPEPHRHIPEELLDPGYWYGYQISYLHDFHREYLEAYYAVLNLYADYDQCRKFLTGIFPPEGLDIWGEFCCACGGKLSEEIGYKTAGLMRRLWKYHPLAYWINWALRQVNGRITFREKPLVSS